MDTKYMYKVEQVQGQDKFEKGNSMKMIKSR